MKVWVRVNRIGWVHLWLTRDAYDAGEASAHFFNGKSDPRWAEVAFTAEMKVRLEAGELMEIEDPGYFPELSEDPEG